MSQKIYPFTDTLDYTKVNTEVSGDKGRLALIGKPSQQFNQPFSSDAGFVYDNTKALFTGTRVEQIDPVPPEVTFHANFFDNNPDAKIFGGSQTAIINGGAALQAKDGFNQMYIPAGGGSEFGYGALNNIQASLFGITLWFTADYAGGVGAGGGNRIVRSAGAIHSIAINHGFGGSTEEYEFSWTTSGGSGSILTGPIPMVVGKQYYWEIYIDSANGLAWLWIGSPGDPGMTLITGAAIPIDVGTLDLSGGNIMHGLPNGFSPMGWIKDVTYVNQIVTTPHPVPTLASTEYLPPYGFPTSAVELPIFTYSGLGEIQSIDTFSSTGEGTERYVIDGKYWDGLAWVNSNFSFAQANTEADVSTNIASLVLSDPSQVPVSVVFDTGVTQQFVDDLTLGYTGQQYATDGSLVPVESVSARRITDFDAILTEPSANQKVRFTFTVDGVELYHDGASWVPSNGTIAESNTLLQAQTNLVSLVDEPDEVPVIVKTLLETTDQEVTPDIDQITLGFFEISECIITASLFDIIGVVPTIDPLNPPQLHVTATRPFTNGNVFIAGTKKASFNVSGNASLAISTTASVGEKLEFLITIPDGRSTKSIFFEPAVVPNETTKPIHQITEVRKLDFG